MKQSSEKIGTEEFTSSDKTITTVASLFSGVGGWEFAAKFLGMKPLWSVELVPWICESFEVNHGHAPIQQDALTVEYGKLERPDILCASPPCQAFTSSGKQARKTKGTGNNNNGVSNTDVGMVVVYAARALLPSYIFLENAPAYRHSKVFKNIVSELTKLGYVVSFKVLNAKNYGVAQSRKRLIMVATLESQYVFPSETNPLGWFSVVQDIIKNTELKPGTLASWQQQGLKANPPTSFPVLVCGGNPSRNKNGYVVHKHSTEPSWTLQLAPNTGATRVLLQDQSVYDCSTKFLARLQSFPDKTIWPKEKTKAIHLIGNSIPPVFAKQLLKEVK